jgi:Helix-turn-helix domain
MADFFHIGNRKLIPLKDVAKIVPYSRDYVARLARDGRIAAAQVNRQWYIDAESLKNFFEHAQLEVQARGEYVRELRKQELDLHEWWSAFLETQRARREARPQRALQKTLVIVILGLFVGLIVTGLAPVATPTQLAALVTTGQLAASIEAPKKTGTAMTWYETGVIIQDGSLENPTGILLTPAGMGTDAADFFSDNVVVEETSPTTGLIHSSSSSSSVPYVRIGGGEGARDVSVPLPVTP